MIEGKVAEIKTTFKQSSLKDTDNAMSTPVLAKLCNKVIHLAMKIILGEIQRVGEITDDTKNLCGHFVRNSHRPPYSYEMIKWYQIYMPQKLHNVHSF